MKIAGYVKKDKAIDIIKSIVSSDYNLESAVYNAASIIKTTEPEDVIKPIRCENCKWSETVEYMFFSCLECTNPRGLDRIVARNDFCSYGKEDVSNS